jgi:uncharacterized protein YihD (DUF1040 family)
LNNVIWRELIGIIERSHRLWIDRTGWACRLMWTDWTITSNVNSFNSVTWRALILASVWSEIIELLHPIWQKWGDWDAMAWLNWLIAFSSYELVELIRLIQGFVLKLNDWAISHDVNWLNCFDWIASTNRKGSTEMNSLKWVKWLPGLNEFSWHELSELIELIAWFYLMRTDW